MRAVLLVLLTGLLVGTGCGRAATPSQSRGPVAAASPTDDPKAGKHRLPASDREEGDWWIGETPHYGIYLQKGSGTGATPTVAHSRLQDTKSRMELLYEKYSLAFGVHSPPLTKATLRLYSDKGAYQAAGGPVGSAAHFNPRTKELVAFEGGQMYTHVSGRTASSGLGG